VLGSHGLARGQAMAALRRYELHEQANQPFETLSGGQQARVQAIVGFLQEGEEGRIDAQQALAGVQVGESDAEG
jgi:ABC-type polar amino acid transport system ATPase subunit